MNGYPSSRLSQSAPPSAAKTKITPSNIKQNESHWTPIYRRSNSLGIAYYLCFKSCPNRAQNGRKWDEFG